jgi:DNA primase
VALPSGFLDELRTRTPLHALVGRRVKLVRSGRQWSGCCPFHDERTPSFYVYDDHFHCFGCGAHGDAITFVMQSQGADFMDAIRLLAAEAGLEIPKPSRAAEAAEKRRLDLHAVLEAAAASFQRRLFLPESRAPLAYLRGRGLSEETIRRFGLGWAGEGRGALTAELARQGIESAVLLEAGLARDSENGRTTDFFFNRIMFPIRDQRGQVISFGGRILGDGQPKYINGPETTLFAKRRGLYGHDLAREAVRTGAPLLVVEGYMDVIALHQAGFGGAVAPLGTALTEEQLQALWRLSPAPILCFDGDAAGARAAARAADLALPGLGIDRTLQFASLPSGEDPDTLLRGQGPAAFGAVLEAKRPFADAVYDLLAEGGDGSPEARAAFRQRLEGAAARIGDRTLAREYRAAWLDRFFARRSSPQFASKLRTRWQGPPPARVPRVASARPGDQHAAIAEQARILTAILLRHPSLLPKVQHAYERVVLPAKLDAIRAAILPWFEEADVLDSQPLIAHLNSAGLAAETAQVLTAVPEPLPTWATPPEAESSWRHFFGLMYRNQLDEEVAAARRDWEQRGDETAQRRLIGLCEERARLLEPEEQTEVKT